MPSSYTGREKRRIAILAFKAAKQSLAGDRDTDTIDPRVKAEMDRIEERAAARGDAEVKAINQQLATARANAAAAKVTMRASSGQDRTAARRQMHEHESTVRRLERQLRSYK